MGYKAQAWAAGESTRTANEHHVLLMLGYHADDATGECWPSIRLLASETGLGERTVRRALVGLAEHGLIEKRYRQRHSDGTLSVWVYRLPFRMSDTSRKQPVASLASGRRTVMQLAANQPVARTGGVATLAGQEPVRVCSSSSSHEPYDQLQLVEGTQARPLFDDLPPAFPLKTVGRAAVTRDEALRSLEVLAAFNEAAGTHFKAKEFLRAIVGRLREHPEVSVEEHRAVVGYVLEHPWWKRGVSPNVIYGNASLFERSLADSRSEGSRKRLTYAGDLSRFDVVEEVQEPSDDELAEAERRIRERSDRVWGRDGAAG